MTSAGERPDEDFARTFGGSDMFNLSVTLSSTAVVQWVVYPTEATQSCRGNYKHGCLRCSHRLDRRGLQSVYALTRESESNSQLTHAMKQDLHDYAI